MASPLGVTVSVYGELLIPVIDEFFDPSVKVRSHGFAPLRVKVMLVEFPEQMVAAVSTIEAEGVVFTFMVAEPEMEALQLASVIVERE